MSKIKIKFADPKLINAIIVNDQEYFDEYFSPTLKDHCAPDRPNDPLIIVAVESGNQKIINKLLLASPNLSQTNAFHWNLFHSITLYNIPNKLTWVNVFIPQKLPYPNHAIEAAVTGNIEYFEQYLINQQTHRLFQKEPLTKLQPIHYAAANGHVKIVELLLKAKPSLIYAKCARGNTPSHFAALNNHVDILKALLEPHLVNLRKLLNKDKNTPIYHAAYGNAYQALNYLSKKFTKLLSLQNEGIFSFLYIGLVNQNRQLLAWISKNVMFSSLKNIINQNQVCDLPLLHYAIHFLSIDTCKWLIDHGADMQQIDQFGKNALDIAKELKKSSLIAYMLDNIRIKLKLKDYMAKEKAIRLFSKSRFCTDFIKPEFITLKELAASKIMNLQAVTLPIELKEYLDNLTPHHQQLLKALDNKTCWFSDETARHVFSESEGSGPNLKS